jgi:NAD(P)-dependent dehydrogenase (short-subunit alcohol dehydrogenase family)
MAQEQAEEQAREQKVAIITGASRGIGASLVDAFRRLGYGVVANSRKIDKEEIKPEIRRDPATVLVEGDISSPKTAERVVNAAIERFGRIDTLVNNAGVFIPKPFLDYSETDLSAMMAVNVAGFFHISQQVITRMLKAGSGHIVNITATIAEQPMAQLPTSLATLTKAGLNAATRALAIEYATSGIRVNAVSPGPTRTSMHPPELHEFLASIAPMGRMAEPREISDAVLYLENAAFVTGEILHVDGGASAGRW